MSQKQKQENTTASLGYTGTLCGQPYMYNLTPKIDDYALVAEPIKNLNRRNIFIDV